jgi:NADH dehydrogenase
VIVGGRFGGLETARGLAGAPCDVVLIDRRNHHVFQPLLYQVATAALSPADIAAPIRSVLRRQDNARVVLGEVTGVDLGHRRVAVAGGDTFGYDWLVLAPGVTHTYFGNPAWAERAPGLKSIEDALEIRRRVLLAFEEAELEDDPEARRAKLTFVVVGGGPTGVEMAGALREIAAQTIPDDFRRVDTSTARVILLEGEDRLLPGMSEMAGRGALHHLEAMGVEVRLGTYLTDLDDETVLLGDERLAAANVIWAAGVKAGSLSGTLGVDLDGSGRVKVEPDCSVPGHPRAFVLGDLAAIQDPRTGQAVPGVAQGALQMGRHVARIIREEIENASAATSAHRPPFRYRDKGNMATVGRARAVADLGGRTYSGFFAWILWSAIHVAFLIGFRNRILVMVNWAWQWLVQARGARLITGAPGDRPPRSSGNAEEGPGD